MSRVVRNSSASRLALAAILVVVAACSLVPMPAWEGEKENVFALLPRRTSSVIDFGENIVFYVPLGVALAVQDVTAGTGIGAAAALSFTLESLQFFIPGRDPSVRDLLANTIGAALGFAFARRLAGPK